MRKTKIICTIGPSSSEKRIIEELISAGTDAFRLNFSHGSLHEHADVIKKIRRALNKFALPIPIIQDLQGPKIRIGKVENDSIRLSRGKEIILTAKRSVGNESQLWTSHRNLAKDLAVGDRVLLDDGLIQLKVVKIENSVISCRIIEGGVLSSNKGVNLPGVAVSLPSLTKKDKVDLSFGLNHEVDMVAISFVRNAEDLGEIRRIISRQKSSALLVTKFEKPEAVSDAAGILPLSDVAIVARGDLGVEMAVEQVPPIQRKIVKMCHSQGIPSIIATHMLESMRKQPRPTRAEVSDVANAVYESADAVLLTAETAVGERPVQTVKMLARIIQAAEIDLQGTYRSINMKDQTEKTVSDAVAESACQAAAELNAKAIVTLTQSGYTARMIAKYRPKAPIIAYTPHPSICRQMNIFWGVIPRSMNFSGDMQKILSQIDKAILAEKIASIRDQIVVVMGLPLLERGTTNLMTVHTVGK